MNPAFKNPTNVLLTLICAVLFTTNLYADFVNGELTVPEPQNGYFEPGDDIVVTMTVTDERGNRLRLDRRDENTLRGVWLWVTGPRQDYHIVEPYQSFWILSNNGGFNQEAPVNGDHDEVTIHIPEGLDTFGTYTVLFNCNRRVGNVWYGLHVYEDFQVGQAEPTFTRSYSYSTCNRPGCHVNVAVHGLTDSLTCILCHTYDFNTPWNRIMHTLRGHELSGVDDCSECHLANAGIDQFNNNSCFSCHNRGDAPDVCGANEERCVECHLEELYDVHNEFIPSPPEDFGLIAPENDTEFDENVVDLSWEATEDQDEEDFVRYEVHLSDSEDFEQFQKIPVEDQTEVVLNDLEFGCDYWWRVLAQDLNTNGTLSIDSYRFTVRGDAESLVSFHQGWNMISINVNPPEELWERREGPDIRLMTERMRIDENNHNIILMKNSRGQFYAPQFDFCNIPYWDLTNGYQVNARQDQDVIWDGQPIPANSDLPLQAGWNMIAYFPSYDLLVTPPDFYALGSVWDEFIIIKDYLGRFAIREFDFSSIDFLTPGQGYQLKVSADAVLNYPEPLEDRVVSVLKAKGRDSELLSPLSDVNMSLILTSISGAGPGDLIEARNQTGILVGRGEIDQQGRCGIAVWGDDQTTPQVEGLQVGELLTLSHKSSHNDQATPITAQPLKYHTNEFLAVTGAVDANISDGFYLSEASLNPFNSTTSFRYGLPETAPVRINVLDLNGRQVVLLEHGLVQAGEHTFTWDASSNSAGIYLIRLQVAQQALTRKVVLVR